MDTKTIIALLACVMIAAACAPQEPLSDNQKGDSQTDAKGLRTIINTRMGDLSLSYANGKAILEGTLQRSTPCVNWQVNTIVMESFPEQVRFSIEDKSTAEMCVQVLGEPQSIHSEASVSEEARITILFREETVFEGQIG
jgi:acyl-CoA synthetase (AMP-forming)/AMP-acid ligase II